MKYSYEEKIQERVIEELKTLPAFSLRKTSKETLVDFFAKRISKNIDSNNIEDVKNSIRGSANKDSLPTPIQKVNKLPNWFGRLKISFEILSQRDKTLGYFSLFLFIIALLRKFLNISIPIPLSLSIILILLFTFLNFSYRLGKLNTNIEATFSQIRRLLKPSNDYAQDFLNEFNARKFNEFSDDFIHEKSEIISKNIIEDEISGLDYALKSANWFYLLYPSCLTFIVIYVSGDALGVLIKSMADFLGFKDLQFFKDLTIEGLSTLVLFPIFFNLSKDMVALNLGVRNKLLKRSLAILEDRFEYRIKNPQAP